MMYKMRRRKSEPTFLLTQGIYNLPSIYTWYEKNWSLMMLYIIQSREMDFSTAKSYGSDWDSYPYPQGHQSVCPPHPSDGHKDLRLGIKLLHHQTIYGSHVGRDQCRCSSMWHVLLCGRAIKGVKPRSHQGIKCITYTNPSIYSLIDIYIP